MFYLMIENIQEEKNIPQDIADIIIAIILLLSFVLYTNGIIHDATNKTHAIVIVNPCAVISVFLMFSGLTWT